MRLLATSLATLILAAPAHAASLPATFAAPAATQGLAATADVASADLGGRSEFVVADRVGGTITALAKTYAAGGTPNAIALGDLDKDGRPDIVSANGATLAVLLSKTDGTFASAKPTSISTPDLALDVAIGQLTADANPDVVLATGQDDVMLLPGDGAGGFGVPVYLPVDGHTAQLALADVNGDGRTDLAVGARPDRVKILLATPAGFVQQAPLYGGGGAGLALADLNADLHPDLIAGSETGGSIAVRLGQTGGTFANAKLYPTDADARDLQIADLNADGRPDVVATRSAGGLVLLAGRGDGTLAEKVALAGGPTEGLAIADSDGDGRLDLATAGDNGFELRRNTTARSAASAPATSTRRALTIDATTSGEAQPQVRLYVRPPGASGFALAAEQASAPFTYTATADGAYAFYTTLVDAAGNEEVTPATPDATTTVALTRAITAELAPFGAQQVGTASAPVEARLRNTGEATLTPRPQLTGGDFVLAGDECTGVTLQPGDECALRVVFAPTAAGARSARMTFDGGGLELTGEGFAAPVVLPAQTPPPAPVVLPKAAGKLVATYKKGKLTKLVVRGVTKGATVTAKRGATTYTKRNASGTVSLARLLKAKGRKVAVTIANTGMASTTQTLTIRKK